MPNGSTDDETVAEMNWRIMKFKPRAEAESDVPEDLDPDKLMRPASSKDTQFFWDGVNAHELRIQRRPDGSLQHPPVPAVWKDHKEGVAPSDYLVSSGNGTVYSYVVHYAPKVPGRTLPFVIALVELDEDHDPRHGGPRRPECARAAPAPAEGVCTLRGSSCV